MNLLQKMSVLGSKVNIAASSAKVYSARKKVLEELKRVISEKSGIDFGESLKHYEEVPYIIPNFVRLPSGYYKENVYGDMVEYFKKYKNAIEDLLFGTGRKFARKTDKHISKAMLKNKFEDVAALEEEKENIGDFLNDLFDDYEYYLKVFEKLNLYYGVKQDDSLSLN